MHSGRRGARAASPAGKPQDSNVRAVAGLQVEDRRVFGNCGARQEGTVDADRDVLQRTVVDAVVVGGMMHSLVDPAIHARARAGGRQRREVFQVFCSLGQRLGP